MRRRVQLAGSKPADIADAFEKLSKDVSDPPDVQESAVKVGTNRVRHGRPRKPIGRHIVFCTAADIVDVSLTSEYWEFMATTEGTIRVVWL